VTVSLCAVEADELVEGEAGPPQDAADRVRTIDPNVHSNAMFKQDKYAVTSRGDLAAKL
jgi:hypothetical protein